MKNVADDSFDPSKLQMLIRYGGSGNEGLVKELINIWMGDVPMRLAKIKAAFTIDDRKQISFHAHQIKSASGTLGANRVSEFARLLEMTAVDASIHSLEDLIQGLESSIADALPYLNAHCTKKV